MHDREIVNVGLIQTSPTRGPDLNMNLAMENFRSAAESGAQIICLPELYRTSYFPQQDGKDLRHLAETIPGPSTEAFSRLASELSRVIIVPISRRTRPVSTTPWR